MSQTPGSILKAVGEAIRADARFAGEFEPLAEGLHQEGGFWFVPTRYGAAAARFQGRRPPRQPRPTRLRPPLLKSQGRFPSFQGRRLPCERPLSPFHAPLLPKKRRLSAGSPPLDAPKGRRGRRKGWKTRGNARRVRLA